MGKLPRLIVKCVPSRAHIHLPKISAECVITLISAYWVLPCRAQSRLLILIYFLAILSYNIYTGIDTETISSDAGDTADTPYGSLMSIEAQRSVWEGLLDKCSEMSMGSISTPSTCEHRLLSQHPRVPAVGCILPEHCIKQWQGMK